MLHGISVLLLTLFLSACNFVSAPVRDQKVPPSHVVRKGESPKAQKVLPTVGGIKHASDQKNHKFLWPTKGKVIRDFNLENEKKGIEIAGSLNQPIQSIADGKVVYSGQGLLGYGNLIIIKHEDEFLSAYAHNQTILVQEGDKIKQGAVVATMGKTGTDQVKLHFELRKDGKPVDPLRYLSQP